MTMPELVQILKATGFPVAYSHFQGPPPSIPFITYVEVGSDNIHADNRTWQKGRNINIELYRKCRLKAHGLNRGMKDGVAR
ncbi:hypothetical protein I8U20_10240 [Thermoactinomyces intermedius]|uniref:Uncharacterized protein n=1 Tax=Thermoactinomyces intermedius TaxID=2024 RepID=A0A8I1DF61_THEIN|nr:hypothetical protein [Thermoactinomyces intermedius]MBA4549275.1 hypothetical protein [Thermoactinomyces intermedius]MBH8595709.1 hypothetical protein [Thermoactinomyces intermedius]